MDSVSPKLLFPLGVLGPFRRNFRLRSCCLSLSLSPSIGSEGCTWLVEWLCDRVPTAWDTDTARLGSVTFVVLSVLIVEATALALVAPKEMPELPGAVLALSSLIGPRSWCSPVPLDPLLLLPAPIISPIFPSRPAVGLTPGGRPVLFFDFGSLESIDPEVLSSSEVPASKGTGRYGGIVFTWLPFLCSQTKN
ncbi:hypothetical protein E2C01_030532 [Portunus trituberculatus]|uniref:Uncharacterized protein n=1 Tax=Portunus trituberculatus TaxID=210409 RepID=A0A5B7EVK2_PORTR|nr:hypothetical protein [Portunus trituberculatus]